jgi:hypothetical protein
MLKIIHATALGVGTLLLLAGCGGQLDGAPVPAEQRAQVSGAPAADVPGTAVVPSQMSVMSGAAVSADETTSLKQQVVLLRREIAEIRQQLLRMPGAPLSAETSPNPRTDPAARLEAERAEQQRLASTEAAFRGEKEDARWSQGSLASVRAAFAEADGSLRGQVSSVECRSQSCRVVIGGDTRGAAGQDLSSVMNRLAATLPNVTAGQIDQGDGRPATVLYLSR